MRVFITGGSGYLGQATIEALIGRGHDVTALARSDYAAATVTALGATEVRGGLADTDVLRAAARDADAAVHLGVAYGPDVAAVDLAAAEALWDTGVYVHTGGVWVFGNTDGVVDESAPQRPPEITAWRAENEARVLAHGGRLVMPGVVYGRSAGLIDEYLAAPGRATGMVPRIGPGTHHWALVHVEDVADLFARALDAPEGSVYSGVTQNVLMADVCDAVASAVGGKVEELTLSAATARMGPIAEAFSLDQHISGARARTELCWTPAHVDAIGELANS